MTADTATGPQILWATAQVRDGALTVELNGTPPAGWRKRFRSLAARLDQHHGQWGEITAKKERVFVGAVSEGAEGDLRHLLESIVLQANAAEEPDAAHEAEGPDTRMTAAFRAFGEQAEPESSLPRRMLGAV